MFGLDEKLTFRLYALQSVYDSEKMELDVKKIYSALPNKAENLKVRDVTAQAIQDSAMKWFGEILKSVDIDGEFAVVEISKDKLENYFKTRLADLKKLVSTMKLEDFVNSTKAREAVTLIDNDYSVYITHPAFDAVTLDEFLRYCYANREYRFYVIGVMEYQYQEVIRVNNPPTTQPRGQKWGLVLIDQPQRATEPACQLGELLVRYVVLVITPVDVVQIHGHCGISLKALMGRSGAVYVKNLDNIGEGTPDGLIRTGLKHKTYQVFYERN